MLSDVQLADTIDPAIRRSLARNDVRKTTIVSRPDLFGDPMIDIQIDLGDYENRPSPEAMSELTRDILEMLSGKGEERFPVIVVHFLSEDPDDEPVPAGDGNPA